MYFHVIPTLVLKLVKDRECLAFYLQFLYEGPGPECAQGSLIDTLIIRSFAYSVWWERWYCELHHFPSLPILLKGFLGFEDFTSSQASSIPEKPQRLKHAVISPFAEASDNQIHLKASEQE